MKDKVVDNLERIFTYSYNKVMMGLRDEFLEQVKFYNSFSQDNVSINDAKQFFSIRINKRINTHKIKVPALQKYILKQNNQIGFKNKTALNTFQLLLSDNPNTTLKELTEMFESNDLNLKKLFEEVDKIKEKDKQHPRRFFFKKEEILKTGEGKRVALTTQWGNNFSEFIKIARKYGYEIEAYN